MLRHFIKYIITLYIYLFISNEKKIFKFKFLKILFEFNLLIFFNFILYNIHRD